MSLRPLHDKRALESFFRAHPFLHIYSLGDLDDRFWPHTKWFGFEEEGRLREVALLYTKPEPAVLLAVTPGPIGGMESLLRVLSQQLPSRFYAHLSPGLSRGLDGRVESHGAFLKMGLTMCAALLSADVSGVVRFTPSDREELKAFYRESYPGNWFDPWMLETGCYHGVREEGRVVCVAGVHVYSPRYRVAALGNIATHPAARGRGLATHACASLCRALLESVDHIGLNVHSGNAAAIRCYEKLGFETIAEFEECTIERTASPGGEA
jgi:RimJ/RimL family protein N-acetyltransferase